MLSRDPEKMPVYQFKALHGSESTEQGGLRDSLTGIQTGQVTLWINERSRSLFEQGKPGQGYAGFLDLQTGEIDLVPAYNAEDNKTRDKFTVNGETKDYFVVSNEPLGKSTGQVHTDGLRIIGKGHKGGSNGLMAGFGIFKGTLDKDSQMEFIYQFRNKSFSQNSFAFQYDELYLLANLDQAFYIMRSIPNDISSRIMETLITQLPVNDPTHKRAIRENVAQHLFDAESEYRKSSPEQIKDKLVMNMFAALNDDQLDVIKRIVALEPRVISSDPDNPMTLKELGLSINAEYIGQTLLSVALDKKKPRKILEELIKLGASEESLSDSNRLKLKIIQSNSIRTVPGIRTLPNEEIIKSVFQIITDGYIDKTTSQVQLMRELFDLGIITNHAQVLRDIILAHGIPDEKKAVLMNALLSAGANPDTILSDNQTALYLTAVHGLAKTAEVLLNHKANPDLADSRQVTPLHIAAQSGHHEIIKLIIKNTHHKIDIDCLDDDGRTPLYAAIKKGNDEIVSLLLQHGADPDIYAYGRTALHEAALHGSAAQVTLLLKHGANIELASELNGDTALHLAAGRGSFSSIMALLQANASLDATNDDGETPIQVAEMREEVSFRGIDVTEAIIFTMQAYAEGSSPLCKAANQNNISYVEDLLELGCKPDEKNRAGESVLHVAVANGNLPLVRLLLNHGADPRYTYKGRSALDYAASRTQNDIYVAIGELLRSKAAELETRDNKIKAEEQASKPAHHPEQRTHIHSSSQLFSHPDSHTVSESAQQSTEQQQRPRGHHS